MTYLITGGAGFIGSNLIDFLLNKGENIVCADNLNYFYDPKTKVNNIYHHFNNKNFHFFIVDIENKSQLSNIFKNYNIEKVIHLAARAGVRQSIEDPLSYKETNVTGTVNLLQLSKEFNVKNFVFASSSSVYGDNRKIPFNENDHTSSPSSPYAASKKACEIYCYNYSYLCDLNVRVLRYFTVYGPRNRPDMAIFQFAEKIDNGEEIIIFGEKDEVKRDWTFVNDIIEGTVKAAEVNNKFEIINLGNNNPVSVTYLVSLLEKELGKKAKIKRTPLPQGDVTVTYADISKAKTILNWEPKTSIEEGVKKFVDWYNNMKNERMQID